MDVLIRGGAVYDGTGAPGVLADVAVRDGKIEAVGALAGAQAKRVVDARGKAVTPGFIDMHSHGDLTLAFYPEMESVVRQGVTTIVGFVALALACRKLLEEGKLEAMPLKGYVAGVSAGIVHDELLLDLCYEEDSSAMVDLNCVMSDDGRIIELQGTGEERPFTLEEQQALVRLCAKGNAELHAMQKAVLGELV